MEVQNTYRGSDASEAVCHGHLIFIDENKLHEQLSRLWLREMSGMSYLPCWQNVKTHEGNIRALVFKVNPDSPRYLAELPLAEQAKRIALAKGPGGENYDYLFNLYDQLHKMGINDNELAILVQEVQKLRKMHGFEVHPEKLAWPW
ncbi:gamma-glutamylcyclotransferase [Piscirickettsia litoralis]|uniref:glutathione-specific gamma-glutamylcyclotransferase n=1 Tax=Piscirickettsia litoralis TaxID=1891921 RepID=A0ABX2ZZP6_9GAMM|nr:gamma-glutamylcyclotransferase [Piscirickettsia litoralis]ODN41700.1 hypothetical protein BGC07_00260 [Piscirickettsia litoralis]